MGEDIANYADDNTPHVIADNIDDLIKSLEGSSTALIQWFDNNILKSNADKCHLVISSNESVTLHVGEYDIKNSKREKLLGVKLDWKLNFDDHISDICQKASVQLNARITPFIGLSRRRVLMNVFFNFQFSYCP